MLDIAVSAGAVTAAETTISADEAAADAGPGTFTGLELVNRLVQGTWPSVDAFTAAAAPEPVPIRGCAVTDGQTVGVFVGRGQVVLPAGRRYTLTRYDPARHPTVLRIPGAVYTGSLW